MHQVIEMANKNDVDACSDLLAASLMAMDSWDWAWGAVNVPAKEEAPIKPTKKKKSK
jgi:hypothetical protein